jgi:proliferating cell nuclear antigen
LVVITGFELRFLDARVWRYALAAVADLVDIGAVGVTSEGLMIRAMDPSHVALIEFHVPSAGFEVFDAEGEVNIPVSFEDFSKILKRASKRDELALEYDGQRFWVELITPQGIGRRFSIPMLSSSAVEKVPELKIDFPVRSKMYPQAFYSAYKVFSEVGEVITFSSTPEGLRISGSSETAEAEIILTLEGGGLLEHQHSGGDVEKASYTIDYFDKVAKASSIAEETSIAFGTDRPCEVALSMPRGARLVLYVAPRSE